MSFTNVNVNIGTLKIKNGSCERLIGTDMACKLSFENHINQICTKARRKVNALVQVLPFLNQKKKKFADECIF